jgi:hypothetical protein
LLPGIPTSSPTGRPGAIAARGSVLVGWAAAVGRGGGVAVGAAVGGAGAGVGWLVALRLQPASSVASAIAASERLVWRMARSFVSVQTLNVSMSHTTFG